jgi:hypothetical protein
VLGSSLEVPALGEVIGKGGRFPEEFSGLLRVAVEFEQVRADGSLPLTDEPVVDEAVFRSDRIAHQRAEHLCRISAQEVLELRCRGCHMAWGLQ